jgi:CRISPR-associated protein Cmr6
MPNGDGVQACRHALRGLGERGTHAGAVLDYYLQKQNDKDNEARLKVLRQAAAASLRAEKIYAMAFRRWRAAPAIRRTVAVDGRLIVGLGAQTALETGITLHHTYGTPLIPGTALKGLASHFCAEVWGADEPRYKEKGAFHHEIFGDQDDAGYIAFHDAWIVPGALRNGSGLVRDVMTPHHGDYYMKGAPPTDFDDPNPVTFLSVTGQFELMVSCGNVDQDANRKKWAELAMKLLLAALQDWGVGGKTNAGYGRMHAV